MFHYSRGGTALSRASAKDLICDSITANGFFLGVYLFQILIYNIVFFYVFKLKNLNSQFYKKS